jgi:Ribonuclease HII
MARLTREERLNQLIQTDCPYWEQGVLFAGIDEVGRGPLFGNVVTACVAMPKEPLLLWVDDSKKLSEKRREEAYEQIMETALYVGIGEATAEEIDAVNILNATKLAMRRAAESVPAELFLVDAVTHIGLNGREIPIIKGDATCYAIAAASIVAKVTRDRQMAKMDEIYPMYQLKKNKGYGTPEHIRALREFGPCPEHRKLFIRNFI